MPVPRTFPLTLCAALFRSSSPGSVEFYCGIGICAGIYLFLRGFRLLQRCHLILDTPFSKIRSASMGMVELNGLAVGPYTMSAPICARPCYFYRTLVWEWKRQGRSSAWVKVAAECMHLPFFLDDTTGRVLVDPRGAELDIHRDFFEQFSDSIFTTKDPVPGNVRAFLGRHGVDTENKIKVEEYCIKPKNALFILGTLAENPGLDVQTTPIPDPEYASLNRATTFTFGLGVSSLSFAVDASGGSDVMSRIQRAVTHGNGEQDGQNDGKTSEVVRISPGATPARSLDMTQQQRVAAALVKAGISNPAAWAAAGLAQPSAQVSVVQLDGANPTAPTANFAPLDGDGSSGLASTQTLRQNFAAKPDGFDQHPPIVIMKGTNNPAFMISWRSQQAVARRLRWKSVLMIWGGPVLALSCLYALLNLLHLL